MTNGSQPNSPSHRRSADSGRNAFEEGAPIAERYTPGGLLYDLSWRGLLHQSTCDETLDDHLNLKNGGPRHVYCGFDPTADSLTIGNLIPIILLKHVQEHGHIPVVVMGGATGRIGDPSGKSAERGLMSDEGVDANITRQREIFTRILGEEVAIVNNLDWWKEKSFHWVLREVGKHFSVNVMIQKDAVRDRLQNPNRGISFTEFSYQILQAYDFVHLAVGGRGADSFDVFRDVLSADQESLEPEVLEKGIETFHKMRVTVQCGGSDQWGNMIAGLDLFDRMCTGWSVLGNNQWMYRDARVLRGWDPDKFEKRAHEFLWNIFGSGLHAFTAPLVTKSDGGKFGKSEAGAVWLSAHRTTPYAFHQFWLNTADADVERFLKMFTFLPKGDIERLVAEHAAAPEKRAAHRALADAVTELVHGKDAVARANAAADALFSGAVAHLDAATLREVFAAAPSSDHAFSILEGDGWSILDALAETGLASSKSQAREFVKGGGVTINGETKAAIDTRLTRDHLLHGEVILLRRGKKNWHLARFA